tara:strand:- start:6636 stop:6842 length:207 start_codon:yes stop_codon:yes gene_type:complete
MTTKPGEALTKIRTEEDVLAALLSYLQLHYVKIANTEEAHMSIPIDPVELTQIVAVLARANTMRNIRP